MKVKIVKEVLLFEKYFIVGKVYEARFDKQDNVYYVIPEDGCGECVVYPIELEVLD